MLAIRFLAILALLVIGAPATAANRTLWSSSSRSSYVPTPTACYGCSPD